MVAFENLALPDLLLNPREALDIEIKAWLTLADANHRADLAKAIIALANHGGGILIIGLSEQTDGQFIPDKKSPSSLSNLNQDAVQNAVQKYIDPPIQCRTEQVTHPETKMQFPIVLVPGVHRVPIKAKIGSPDNKLVKDRVYIRRPGPKSEEPQTSAEWDQLFERCVRARKEELLTGIRDLLAGQVPHVDSRVPTLTENLKSFIENSRQRWNELTSTLPLKSSPRFPHGFYEAGFAIDGVFESPSLSDFRTLLGNSLRSHSGWPPFVIINREPYHPRPVNGAIETFIGPDTDRSTDVPAHHDFWRISPDGMFFTRRGLNEDGRHKDIEPGTTFSITTPTWRIGEIILQAHYVAMELGAEDANLVGRFRWQGLSERYLVTLDARRYLSSRYTAHQDEYETEVTTTVRTVPTALPEIVFSILAPLYELFDFFKLPKRLVEEELADMMRHRF